MDISTPINIVHSYHAKERQLFSRMIFALGIDPSRSMLIIAFWLWLEENGHADIIRRISSFDNDVVLAIATVGQNFIESLHLNPLPSLHDQPSAESNSNNQFRQAAIHGISYYLNNVCLKAFDDIRAKADAEAQNREVETLVHQMSQAYLDYMNVSRATLNSVRLGLHQAGNTSVSSHRDNMLNLQEIPSIGEHTSRLTRTAPIQSYVPHGEGTSRNTNRRIPNMMEVAHALESIYPLRGLLRNMGMSQPLSSVDVPMLYRANIANVEAPPNQRAILNDHLTVGGNTLLQHYLLRSDINSSLCPRPPLPTLPQQLPRGNVPRDERTLFVTFSNGYPLTEEELYEFFMRHYGDVELITVEKPMTERAPLFAHVSFHSLDTVLQVLDGNRRMKFMTKGRHLWARRFIPKRLQNQV